MRHAKHLHVWPLLLMAGAVGLVLLPAKPFLGDRGSQSAPNSVGVATASSPAKQPQTSGGSWPQAKVLAVATTTAAAFKGAEAMPSASWVRAIAPVASPVAIDTPLPAQSPAAIAQTSTDGRIGGTAVNARSGPQASAGVLFVLSAGEAVRVGESTGGWTHVFRQNGQDGWVYHRYLAGPETVANAAPSTPALPQKAHLAPPNFVRFQSPAPVLAAPADEARLLFVLQPGARVQIAETRGIWIRVVTTDGISGWTQS